MRRVRDRENLRLERTRLFGRVRRIFIEIGRQLHALDLLNEHVVRDTLIFQSLLRGHRNVLDVAENYPFAETELFERPGYPLMHFVERRYADDPTNWWIPNRACAQAMQRSAGFSIICSPDLDVFVCKLEADRGAQSSLKSVNRP